MSIILMAQDGGRYLKYEIGVYFIINVVHFMRIEWRCDLKQGIESLT